MSTIDLLGMSVPSRAALMLFLELALGLLFLAAFVLAARHRGLYHHWLMLGAFLGDELIAKPLMLQRLNLGVLGHFPYDGTFGLPHLALSIAGTVLGVVTIVWGFKFKVRKEEKMFMPPARKRVHMFVGLSYLGAWALSLLFGLMIFLRFYGG